MSLGTTDASSTILVDAKGLKCPMPVIKLQQQVRKSRPGDLICIACTDPGAEKDISSWAKVNKHQLTNSIKTEYGCDITVQVKRV
ncbi:MAG: sulfurtransferase TusA family protein [Pseudomonadota bacterium]|nr:sulfurtransferase TusA family protein [Pseudomonadota bacterium]